MNGREYRKHKCERKGWDSNPRYGLPHTRFPGEPVQPLLHLSVLRAEIKTDFKYRENSLKYP